MDGTGHWRIGLLATLSLLLASAADPQLRKPVALHDGEPLSITGRLEAHFTGWDARLVVRTAETYQGDFDGGGIEIVHEIEIDPSFHLQELSRHIDEVVTAKGKLQFGGPSPYYWNGVMLMPTTIALADGRVLLPALEPKDEPIPNNVRAYLYTMTMVPRVFGRTIQVIDLTSNQKLPETHAGGCGVSGGGRGGVMNCGCADSFTAAKGGVATHHLSISELKPFDDPDAPQLQVSEAAKRPLTVEVLCVRKETGEK